MPVKRARRSPSSSPPLRNARPRIEASTPALSTSTMSAAITGAPYRCPICLSPPLEPYITRCAHVFCYECLRTHLEKRRSCPQCRDFATPETISPAFLANTAAAAASSSAAGATTPATPAAHAGGNAASNEDCTPEITDARSSRRLSPPRITRRRERGAGFRGTSPTSTAKLHAGAQALAALTSPPSPNSASAAASAALPGGPIPPSTPLLRNVGAAGSASIGVGGTGLPFSSSLAAILANDDMDPEQIAQLISMLERKKNEKKGNQKQVRNALLLDFLNKARSERQGIITKLMKEVKTLTTDIGALEEERSRAGFANLRAGAPSSAGFSDPMTVSSDGNHGPGKDVLPGLRAKRRRVDKNYVALNEHYFETVAPLHGDARGKSLKKFTDDIMKVTQYSRFRCHASLLHVARYPDAPGSDVFKASNIVSSIEFDRESKLLATAGVTKRIKIFDFPPVESKATEVHYPVKEIPARAKLSWVCWNPYIRQQLVSSDYEGIVTLWDVNRGQPLNEYEEHEKRAWSVDFCTADPRVFASGSDDGRVKIWTTAQSSSVVTIENGRANICSVKFQPQSLYNIAFGSADFNVHFYDIRSPRQALRVFKSHTRTVSYVKFISAKELVSACVDSTVKLWDLETMELERTFKGHVNDKNFVGLSVTNDYIACGSEQNSIYAYYKAIPEPIAQYRFPNSDPLTGEETQDDDESFVSSVCWCPKNPSMLVGANSLGVIKVLNLTDAEDENSEDSDDSSGD